MGRLRLVSVFAVLLLVLGGCGSHPRDRATGGAGVGAGAGFTAGLAFGGIGAIPGALIGAGVGATSGALTTPNEVNLGEPVWR